MNPRKLIFAIVILLFGLLLVHRVGDVESLARTLKSARPGSLAIALVLQSLTLCNQPALYQSLYALLGLAARWRDLAPLVWAGHFVNVVTPSAGLGGTALLLDDARRRGWDASRVALANTLYFLLNFAWFALLLAAGMAALWLRHDLKPYEIAASAILFAGVIIALGALILVALRPAALEKPLAAMARGVNVLMRRVLGRAVWPEAKARGFALEFSVAARTLRSARGRLLRPIFHTLWVDGLEIGVLAACFAAFPGAGQVSPSLILAGYAVGTLFLVVSVTPQGLGVVEGVMTATFVSLGVPLERAAVVVLVYRGLSFWLPLGAGFLASRRALQAAS
jgi:uncharacterized protein (TIRG00374 family)